MQTKKEYVYKEGQKVYIEGKPTTLKTKITRIPGGWIVDPRIDNIRYWNEDAMTTTAPRRKK